MDEEMWYIYRMKSFNQKEHSYGICRKYRSNQDKHIKINKLENLRKSVSLLCLAIQNLGDGHESGRGTV